VAPSLRLEEPPVSPSPAPGHGAKEIVGIREELADHPQAFQFFQAVELLQRIRSDRDPVGGFGEPAREAVHFAVPPSLGFPTSEIRSLDTTGSGPARMEVNFLGLTGPQGLLPLTYTVLVADRVRSRDTALRDFLDIFHHRALSLFHRGWRKHRFDVIHEDGGRDPLREHVLDLVGLGLETSRSGSALPLDAMVFYSGLLGPQQRSGVALEQLVEDLFDTPAEVVEFAGAWYRLEERDLCLLGEDGSGSRLGWGAVVGDEVWNPQARVRIRVGPLDRSRYRDFLPGGEAHTTLSKVVRFFTHDAFEAEVQLILRREEVAGVRLGGEGAAPLGWSTWLRTRTPERDPDEAVVPL